MVKTVETSAEDTKKLVAEGGNAQSTLLAKEKAFQDFRKWITNSKEEDLDQLISSAKENNDSKNQLEALCLEYLNSIRVLDKGTKNLLRPKVIDF